MDLLASRPLLAGHCMRGIPCGIFHAGPNITKAERMWYVRLSKLAIIIVSLGLFGWLEIKCQTVHAVA